MTEDQVERVAITTEQQCKLFGCDLIDLLRREGRHSGVWFAERLLQAADIIERAAMPPQGEPTEAMIEAGGKAIMERAAKPEPVFGNELAEIAWRAMQAARSTPSTGVVEDCSGFWSC